VSAERVIVPLSASASHSLQELVDSLPSITKAIMRRKVNPKIALLGHKIPKDDLKQVKQIYEKVEGRDKRVELNLYISGYDEDDETPGSAYEGGQPGQSPEESPAR